jgi:hypothetical protein
MYDYLIYGGIVLGLIVVLLVIVKARKRSKNESEALRELGESDPKRDYYVLSSIQFHDGIRAAKIDHLVVNPSGIHAVIEYAFEGIIEGSENDETWSYENKGVSDTFINPIKTAKALRQSIDKVLKKDYPVFLYIVFPERAELKKRRMNIPVVNALDLKEEMNKNFKSKKKISSHDVKLIYDLFVKVKNR